MAPSNTPYDPIVSVEGMYKGSLTRLGYFFKDPKLYGKATLAVLRETAKRYDDALDDCLIQILDAKWLLEHQLAQNRARRAREAAETEVASNKRKLESSTDGESITAQDAQTGENPAKRIKVQQSPCDTASPAKSIHEGPTTGPLILGPVQIADEGVSETVKPVVSSTTEEIGQTTGEPDKKDLSQGVIKKEQNSNEVAEVAESKPAAVPSEEAKEQNEEVAQSANDEYMNFESMFGDPNAGNDQNNDLHFDLDLSTENLGASNPFDSVAHDANNLELLPGLESYANASGDDFNMLNLPSSTAANQAAVRALDNNFDLPEIQGDSSFNDLFADGDFGGDASLMDLDLEDGFFNT